MIRQLLPAPVRRSARKTYNSILDQVDRLRGRHDPLVPPRNLNYIGDGDYKGVAEHFFAHLVEIGGLRPDDRILDIGSGLGRMAIPLTRYLSPGGSYQGIEIVPRGVEWSQREITARHPNFRFTHADIYNKMYNPGGQYKASEYRFPFADRAFNFVFATSVFTHMYPADVARYLSEIARVLQPGGSSFTTFFILTPESRRLVASGQSSQRFVYQGDGYMTTNDEVPENAIAFDECEVRRMHSGSGLTILDPIYHGWWSGRQGSKSYQDIVLARKP
ncbi:class I SAM-dependent methyltransferase [soil metagenome]